jgi:hypothetical protein
LFPQEPQLFASVDVLVHAPLQATSPAGQVTQAPLMHDAPAEQAFPHEPQFLASLWTLVHVLPPQSVCPDAHEHAPPVQHAPLMHVPQPPCPQAPQLFLSVDRFVQPVPEQYVLPAVAHVQVPKEHTASVEAHTLPHVPQLFLSDVSSMQEPLQQAFPVPQALPQAPQLLLSVRTLRQLEPHSVEVAPEQVIVHTPALHVADPPPWPGPGHTWPHEPQLFVSALSLTQAPLQIVVPAGHWHDPPMHRAPPVQMLPQAPQLLVSELSLTHVPLHDV